ncbi:MAG: hypothetical protein HUJ86_07790 [Synergistes sp.]|nr:hypothetical protein [Synergistes sp.]
MDEENQGAWRSQGHPHFNMRSVMGKRAEFAGAEFILCGSMPSAKSFLRADPKCAEERNDS